MRTNDIVKTGIDRNFIRQCYNKGLINPDRKATEGYNRDYDVHIYSQDDVETIWNSYLYRKMGLSFKQIKDLNQDKEIDIRASLSGLIDKYERQIKELQTIVEFTKYVKGLGFLPDRPDKAMESENFTDYLVDYMDLLDKDKKMKKIIEVAEYVANADSIEALDNDENIDINAIAKDLIPSGDIKAIERFTVTLMGITSLIDKEPDCNEVQEFIKTLYKQQKELFLDDEFRIFDYCVNNLRTIATDSVGKAVYIKILGEEATEFFAEALYEYISINEPEKTKELFTD